jgi:Peptidase A4 family
MHGRLRSFRARALLACVPAVGLAIMATAGTASASHAPAPSRSAVQTAIEHVLARWHPTNHAIGTGLKKVGSTNWSGYADTGSGFSSVVGSWKQPTVKGCSATGKETVEVFWVGLDGFSDGTVEQDGTGVACGKGIGAEVYFSWWEMFPSNSIQVVSEAVKPGDKITSSVTRSGTKYTLKLSDSKHSSAGFTEHETCSASTCDNASAEWIAERAAFESSTGKITLSPLPNFGTWTVSSASAKAGSKSGSISKFTDDQITMFNKQGGHVMAQPGALNSSGNSFKDVWKASS